MSSGPCCDLPTPDEGTACRSGSRADAGKGARPHVHRPGLRRAGSSACKANWRPQIPPIALCETNSAAVISFLRPAIIEVRLVHLAHGPLSGEPPARHCSSVSTLECSKVPARFDIM